MRKDKDLAFELRKNGKSYRDIQQQLGISRSTLCDWFKDIPWSQHLKAQKTSVTWKPQHMQRMRTARLQKLENLYKDMSIQAAREYERYRKEPLFWAGLMAYAGEGDKRTKHLIRITNTEAYIHRIFVLFVEKYLLFPKEYIKLALLLYPDHIESTCKEVWSNALSIPKENFHKSHVLQGKEKVKRLQYGICMSIIPNTALKKKLLTWISLAQDEQFNAIIV